MDTKKENFINDINSDIQRLYLEIQSMLYFNIFDFDEKEDISVLHTIKEAISKVDLLLKSRNLEVKIIGNDFTLQTRQNLFSKMFMSIFENAIAYAEQQSTIQITLDSKIINTKYTRWKNKSI